MTKGNTSDVSVVILTKNSQRTLEKCLSSAINQEPREILIVDGQSKDSTHDIARRHGIKIIIDPSGSMGHSRQLGVEAAK
ncbi:MAG: glycosyltransferase, partial [Candidatus Bathyarchaeia archaeon]